MPEEKSIIPFSITPDERGIFVQVLFDWKRGIGGAGKQKGQGVTVKKRILS